MLSTKERIIMLVGESGCGKSSFINSVANYSRYKSFDEARKKPITKISSTFTITNSKYEEKEMSTAENGNEKNKDGEYKFEMGSTTVKLIDTPSISETGDDDIILTRINTIEHLHAVGIVLKNTETKFSNFTPSFRNFLRKLLSNLDETTMKSIIFIFTYSKSNNFEPGPIKNVMELFIKDELKNSPLVLNKNNMYCFDNKSYEYLIALHNDQEFDKKYIAAEKDSWAYSYEDMVRLVKYVRTLSPCRIQAIYDAMESVNPGARKDEGVAEYDMLWLSEAETGKSLFTNSNPNHSQYKEKYLRCKNYKIQLEKSIIVRLIDTRNEQQVDKKHIAGFINQNEHLQAIEIVMNDSEIKMTEMFIRCLRMLLTDLTQIAAKKIVFIVTIGQQNSLKPDSLTNVINSFIKNQVGMSHFSDECYFAEMGALMSYLMKQNQGKFVC